MTEPITTEHTYAECGHRVDYASQAEHDRDCPAAEAITTPPAEPADYITIDPAAGAHLAAAVQAEVDAAPAEPTGPCTEDGCDAQVADTPDSRCGGSEDGGPQGCGRLFCPDHLYSTDRDGDLCAGDYDNLGADRVEASAEVGDVGKCGRQTRSYSRGCPECGHGQPAPAESAGARMLRLARESADQMAAAHRPAAGFRLTRAEQATATGTVRGLLVAGWTRDTVTRMAEDGTDYVLVHGSGRQVQVGMRVDGRHQLVLDGLDVDQMAGAVRGAGLAAEPAPTAAERMAARYRQAEEAWAISRALGDEMATAWALRAMSRRQAALGRIVLAAVDARQVTR